MPKLPGFLVLLVMPLLAACESSIRLPALSSPFGQAERAAPPPQVQSAPTPQVQSAPLAPPVAQQPLPPPVGAQAAAPVLEPLPAEPQITPAQPGQAGTTPGSFGQPPRQAALEPPRQPAPRPASTPAEQAPAPAPTRNSVTGNWTASEAAGSSCKVVLSSTPKLDLYNAGSSGCQSRELQRVSAWELRGDEVYLYEPGGTVAARLRASGGQRFSGAMAKTGAPLTLAK